MLCASLKHLLTASLCFALMSCATVVESPPSPPEITLTKGLHFVKADGNDLLVSAGTYTVSVGNSAQIELASMAGSTVAEKRTLEAISTNVGHTVAAPIALYIPWDNDEHHIILVQPSGEGLEAVGTGSGVRTRGLAPRPLPPDVVKKALLDFQAQPGPQK